MSDIIRVWRVTKKPSLEEYKSVLKIVAIGVVIIGTIGFAIQMLWEFFLRRFF